MNKMWCGKKKKTYKIFFCKRKKIMKRRGEAKENRMYPEKESHGMKIY